MRLHFHACLFCYQTADTTMGGAPYLPAIYRSLHQAGAHVVAFTLSKVVP